MQDRRTVTRVIRRCSRLATFLSAVMSVALLVGCGEQAPPDPQSVTRLPVSHNEVMVALVNQSADPIWVAAWRNPQTEDDWRTLERLAYQLQIAGALLVMPGTGPNDDAWAADPNWRDFANQLMNAGAGAVVAANSRDVEAISAAGDQIVEVCEGCHFAFKPDVPSGGMYGTSSPTAADFED